MTETLRFDGPDDPFDSLTLDIFATGVELSALDSTVSISEAGLRWLVETGGPQALQQIRRAGEETA